MTTTRLPTDATMTHLRNTCALTCTCPNPHVIDTVWDTRICGRCEKRPVATDLIAHLTRNG